MYTYVYMYTHAYTTADRFYVPDSAAPAAYNDRRQAECIHTHTHTHTGDSRGFSVSFLT